MSRLLTKGRQGKLTSPDDSVVHFRVSLGEFLLVPFLELQRVDAFLLVDRHRVDKCPSIDPGAKSRRASCDIEHGGPSRCCAALRLKESLLVTGGVETLWRGEQGGSESHAGGEGEDGEKV